MAQDEQANSLPKHKLGQVAASEALIGELYIDLRRRINGWAAITKQTAQARMGYVGQHLVSVVTGYPGGRSGARGKDLVISEAEHAEIKTCYRVDQLGACADCKAVVASIERDCPGCGSPNIVRKDDSKWLITIRNTAEYDRVLEPKHYYLVLFEYVDVSAPNTIRASIWQVDPLAPGFALAMIDYFSNIKANSESGAPFNLWPYSLKFALMKPRLLYRSLIASDDTIKTQVFESPNTPLAYEMIDLDSFSRATNLTVDKVVAAAHRLGLGPIEGKKKSELIASLMQQAEAAKLDAGTVADALAHCLYRPEIEKHLQKLPPLLRSHLQGAGLLD